MLYIGKFVSKISQEQLYIEFRNLVHYVGYDLLHCVRENQSPDAYHFLYLSIFLSL